MVEFIRAGELTDIFQYGPNKQAHFKYLHVLKRLIYWLISTIILFERRQKDNHLLTLLSSSLLWTFMF